MCQVDPCSRCPWKKEETLQSAFGAFLDAYNEAQKKAEESARQNAKVAEQIPTNSARDAISALRHLSLAIDTYINDRSASNLTYDIIQANVAARDVLKLHP